MKNYTSVVRLPSRHNPSNHASVRGILRSRCAIHPVMMKNPVMT
jgi:hypothetical protein